VLEKTEWTIKTRMDNPNTLATMCTQNTEQINSKPKGHSRMENPETLATLGTQDTGRKQTKQLNVRENRRGVQEWKIQRHWQNWVHKTQDEDHQNKKQYNTTQLRKDEQHRPHQNLW
jgi:hypothetical protein